MISYVAPHQWRVRAIWYDEEEKKYKVAENYIAFLLTKSKTFRELRENKDNEEWLRNFHFQGNKIPFFPQA